jgi:hypothetical protein
MGMANMTLNHQAIEPSQVANPALNHQQTESSQLNCAIESPSERVTSALLAYQPCIREQHSICFI